VDPLALVKLTALMERTSGRPDVKIGVVDGPVLTGHPDLAGERLRELPGGNGATCAKAESAACLHGTFITGILAAKRGTAAPAICPGCTFLVRPIFAESISGTEHMPSATPQELAAAISDCVDAGAWVINLSLTLAGRSVAGERKVEESLNQAARRGVIVVAAAGNDATLGSSVITRHPWVIPVVACDARGKPTYESNLGRSIGRLGLTAPGDRITSLGPGRESLTLHGTSVAAPFVTGAIALLLSEFPAVTAAEIRLAVIQARTRRASVVPPLLDASAAHRALSTRT
jgi:subtilisin family serine protease